jgi:hypothetical protein
MRRMLPVLTLFVLSPFLAEVLFGATPLSNLGALLVVLPLYGGGAVLVRELARRRSPGWGRIFLLGAAYGIIEEGLIIQSMFDPNMFNAGLVGGRAFGINWIWTMWTIGYHIVWSISIPILLAELLFPTRRSEPWLGRIGLIVISVLYLLGALALAAIYRFAVAPDFQIPVLLNLLAAFVAIVLIVLALTWPTREPRELPHNVSGKAPSPWIVGLLGLLMAAFWFGLLDLPHFLRTGGWAFVPIVLGIAPVAGFASLIRRWSGYGTWSDLHRLALAVGPLIVSTLWGLFRVTTGSRLDQLGIVVFGILAAILLVLLARRLQHQDHETEAIHRSLRSSQQ